MHYSVYSFLLLFIATVSADVYVWKPNSNWGNEQNWNGSRLPCAPETVRFQVPPGQQDTKFAVKINVDTSLKKLKLVSGARVKLGAGIRIRFSSKNLCGDRSREIQQDAVQTFIGLKPHPWECASNWRKVQDNSIPTQSPCGVDTVAFPPESTFSWISFNAPITVGSINWMGTTEQSVPDIPEHEQYFLQLDQSAALTVDMTCTFGQFENCPCKESDCSFYSTIPPCNPEVSVCPTCAEGDLACKENSSMGPDKASGESVTFWPIIVGVLSGLLLLVLIVIGAVFWHRKKKRKYDEHFRYETDSQSISSMINPTYAAKNEGFQNPIYDEADNLEEKYDEDGLPVD